MHSIRPGWFYHSKEDTLVKSAEKLFDIYLSSVGRGSTLLLNVPPDKRGLFHENDVKALQGWRAMLDSEFKTDLAKNARVEATSYRGENASYSPLNVTDDDKDTYWTTDDDVTTARLELQLEAVTSVKYIVLHEYIRLGQRVKEFNVEIWQDNAWVKAAVATTIGYKRILKLEPVNTDKIRVSITASKACPLISSIKIY